jgi:hypothetical protein
MAFNPLKTLFKSLALAIVVGAIGFFAGNFLTILGFIVYGSLTHHTPDFTLAYKRGGVAIGIIAFCLALVIGIWRDLRIAGRPDEADDL